jgi:guanylate kinase
MKKGRIFIVSAPSGSGKTTIEERILKKFKWLKKSISVTTRPPRRGEKKHKNYIYCSKEKFKKDIKGKKFLEWESNFGNFYGTPKEFILNNVNQGKSVLLSIDVRGALNVKKIFSETVLIFIKPPSIKELEKRLKGRNTDKDYEIKKRLNAAKREMKSIKKYDYVVINKNLSKAVNEVAKIINTERRK